MFSPKTARINLFISMASLAAFAFPAHVLAADRSDSSLQKKRGSDTVIQLSLGLDYSTGKYGDTRATKVLSSPIGLKVANGPLTFRVSVPFVRLKGPGALLLTNEARFGSSNLGAFDSSGSGSGSSNSGSSGSNSGSSGTGSSGSGSSGSGSSGSGSSGSGSSGSGSSGSGSSGSGSSGSGSGGATGGGTSAGAGNVVTTPANANRIDTGFGDVVASATYTLSYDHVGLYIDATAKVKIPTASTAKRLGTGKADFIAALDVTKNFGPVDIYGGVRRRFAGSSAVNPLRDTWGESAGISVNAAKGLNLALDYDHQQSSFVGNRSSSEITASATVRVTDALKVQVYGTTGFNSASVDGAGGLSLIWRFD